MSRPTPPFRPRIARPRVSLALRAVVGTLSLGALLAACGGGDDGDGSRTVAGAPQALGQGTVRSVVTVDAQGTPTAIGLEMTEAALQGLPTTPVDGPAAAELTLPRPAEAAATGIDHIEVDWNPQGHDPEPIYTLAHFDFHFYRITKAEQLAILPTDPAFATKAARLPAAPYVPVNYVAPPGDPVASTVPQMGLHWTDVTSPEFNGQPFTTTFIHGSYDGRFTFAEPMVTLAFLQTRPDFQHDLAQPERVAIAGAYPTRYRVSYDASAKVYRILLDGLVKRDAS